MDSTNGRGSYKFEPFPEQIIVTDPDGITTRGYHWSTEQMLAVRNRLDRLIPGGLAARYTGDDRGIVTAALNAMDWDFVGPGSHAMCSARTAAEYIAVSAVSAGRADERGRLATLIRSNEQTLNDFAREGNTAGLIAYLIESIGDSPAAPSEPRVNLRISCVDAPRAIRDLVIDGPVYTDATTVREVDPETLEISGPRDEVIMVLVDLSFLSQISREEMRDRRAQLKMKPVTDRPDKRP